jgi:phosphohistidine phosphatase
MKTLYLIRHAKSSWGDPSLTDFERPLNKRGKRDAPFMGQRLKAVPDQPDLMVSSSARRARKTARIIAREIGYDKNAIEYRDEMYGADLDRLLKTIWDTGPLINALALVGHNFEITDCAEWLTGETIVNIPTCGIVAIAFKKVHWQEIGRQEGRLLFFDYPKLHVSRSHRG